MKKSPLTLALIVCAALAATACEKAEEFLGWMQDDPVVMAKKRVEYILEGMTADSKTPTELVVARWYTGRLDVPDEQLFDATREFEAWCADQGLKPKSVKTFEITSVEPSKRQDDVIIVQGKVNGKKFRMRVPTKDPISWI